jgi:nitrate/nitrite transport system permease protein
MATIPLPAQAPPRTLDGGKLGRSALSLALNTALALVGVAVLLGIWVLASSTFADRLPLPLETWERTKRFILEPFAYRGEMDQGILRFTWLSLVRVAKGYALAVLIGVPLGFLLGSSKLFARCFDPVFQVLRPVSPLAWFPLGLVLFFSAKSQAQEFAGLFTIAMCAMWPTVLNTAAGVRSVPQDYLNVARVLNLSRFKTFWKILVPSTVPYMFTGFRLSLGLAWLVIVAVEMLTGRPGVGGFLYDGYNSGIYANIILSIITIGLVGLLLDRLMNAIEVNVHRFIG